MPDLFELHLPLRRFLTLPDCPADWRHLDLYAVRDEQVAFYVGQSFCAFARVWEHIHGGVHGHSIMGRFILANWPRSGSFTVDLLSSQAPRFVPQRYNLDAAERCLIEELTPCFNVALNSQPAALPPGYRQANAPVRQLVSYKRMLREAAYVTRLDTTNTEWE